MSTLRCVNFDKPDYCLQTAACKVRLLDGNETNLKACSATATVFILYLLLVAVAAGMVVAVVVTEGW